MGQPLALLCGLDRGNHFENLWAAGFSVEQCDSEYDLVRWVVRGKAPQVICVVESLERPVDEVSLTLLKTGTSAPLVLFQARAHADGHSWWDLAVPPGTPSSEWMRSIDELMRRSWPDGEAGSNGQC